MYFLFFFFLFVWWIMIHLPIRSCFTWKYVALSKKNGLRKLVCVYAKGNIRLQLVFAIWFCHIYTHTDTHKHTFSIYSRPLFEYLITVPPVGGEAGELCTALLVKGGVICANWLRCVQDFVRMPEQCIMVIQYVQWVSFIKEKHFKQDVS